MVSEESNNVRRVAQQPPQAKKKGGRLLVRQIFVAAKNTIATHPKLCLKLIKVYQKVSEIYLYSY